MRSSLVPLSLAVLALIATACGGGGGGDGDDLNLEDGPRIAAFTPEPGAADVEPDVLVEIVFAEPLDPTSVLPTQLRLSHGGVPIGGTASYSAARQAIAFAAADPLPTDTDIDVVLQAGIRTPEGSVREQPLAYAFATRLAAVASPVRLEAAAGYSLHPSDFLVDGSGYGALVYNQLANPGVDYRFARIWTRRGGFAGAVSLDLDDAPGSNSHDAHRIGPAGFITAWKTNAHSDRNDALLQWYDAQTDQWSGEVSLDTVSSFESAYPTVARSETGHMIAVWEQERLQSGNESIYTRVYEPGTGWGLRLGIDGGNEDADSPHLAMNRDGHAVVLFRRHFGDDVRMYARLWNPTDGWSELEPLGAAPTDDGAPRRALIGPDGTALVVWYERDDLIDRLYARRLEPDAPGGPDWGPTHELTPPAPVQRFSRVHGFVDAAGNATVAVQYSMRSNDHAIATARYQVGAGWGPTVRLDHAEGKTYRHYVADEHESALALTWHGTTGDSEDGIQRFVAVTGPDGLFRAPVPLARLEGNRADDHRADVALTPGGGAIVVWTDGFDGPSDVLSTLHARVLDRAGGLGPTRDVDVTPGKHHAPPRIDVDALGRGLIVFSRGSGGYVFPELWYAEIR